MPGIPSIIAMLVLAMLLSIGTSFAATVSVEKDPSTGFEVYSLRVGSTQATCVPAAGANVVSIQVDGVEYFRQPESLEQLPGVGYGNPVLYPTPNRVRNAQLTFDGKSYQFDANSGNNFIHGLVNRFAWKVDGTEVDQDQVSLRCVASFERTSALYEKFPIEHRLYVTITVSDGRVRWRYRVDNVRGLDAVPFGFALHPYFVYQGARRETMLTIPATHSMQAENKLPTGNLLAADKLDHPLGEPFSLAGVSLDDVYFGMRPEAPTTIDFRDVGRRIDIHASRGFHASCRLDAATSVFWRGEPDVQYRCPQFTRHRIRAGCSFAGLPGWRELERVGRVPLHFLQVELF